MSVPTINPMAAALRVQLMPNAEVILLGLDPVPLPGGVKADKAPDAKAPAPEPPQKPAPAAPIPVIETARQTSAARQSGIAPLMADLEQAIVNEALPAPVRAAAQKVLELQTPIDAKVTPEAVKRAVAQSGLFLEPTLAQAKTPAPDLKSALLVLRQVLRAAAPGPAPTPSPATQAASPTPPLAAHAGAQTPVAEPPGTPAATAPLTLSPQGALASGLSRSYAPAGARLPQPDLAPPAAPATLAAATAPTAPALPRTAGAPATGVPAAVLPQPQTATSPAAAPLPPNASVAAPGLQAATPPPSATPSAAPAPVPTASPAPALPGAAPASIPTAPLLVTPFEPRAVRATLPVPTGAGARIEAQLQPLPSSPPPVERRAVPRPPLDPDAPPPPPVKGAPPQAQKAAQPHLPAGADPATVLHHLERATSGAIARQELFQLASLPDAPRADGEIQIRTSSWLFEVPMATPQGPAVAQFEIEKDGSSAASLREGPVWRTRFSVDVEPLGLVHALLVLAGGKTTVTLWAERRETLARLTRAQGELAGTLDAEVAVYPGQPLGPRTASGRFVDSES